MKSTVIVYALGAYLAPPADDPELEPCKGCGAHWVAFAGGGAGLAHFPNCPENATSTQSDERS